MSQDEDELEKRRQQEMKEAKEAQDREIEKARNIEMEQDEQVWSCLYKYVLLA